YCTIEDGARIGRNVRIDDDVRIGAGAVIYTGVEIGPGAMIAAGAVVLQDIPEKATVFGNPAQVVEAD
ncbi:MAG: DapH/DapD/GlmU-related protein, partial [Bacteroidota bacterium]